MRRALELFLLLSALCVSCGEARDAGASGSASAGGAGSDAADGAAGLLSLDGALLDAPSPLSDASSEISVSLADAGGCADRTVVCDGDGSADEPHHVLVELTIDCPNYTYCGGTQVYFDALGCPTLFTTTVADAVPCLTEALAKVRFACADESTVAFKPANTLCGGP